MKFFNDIINSITKEDIEKYYIEENHSQKECAEHFGILQRMFNKVLKYYGIHKDNSKHSELIKKSKLEKYGNENYNNREMAEKTCIEKYGVKNPFQDFERVKNGYMKSFGSDHPMHDDEIKTRCIKNHNYSESSKKGRETYLQNTGYDNPAKNPECIKKGIQTKIKNGVYDSPHESDLERRMYKILCRKYSIVLRHYRDPRYSRDTGYMFECDFYIPSEDLFIELNAHPTHGLHPFSKEKDKELYEKLIKSNKPWDKNFLESWTVRDVEKMNIAKENNLNYIVIYPKTSVHENIGFNNKKYSKLITYLIKKLNNKKNG